MNVSLHTTIKRTGLALVMTSTLVAVAVGSALAVDRPAASFYTKQQLQTMSQSWAARARFERERDRPAASFYTPQQLETMSESWAARGGVFAYHPKATSSALVVGSRGGFDWGVFGIGAAAILGLVLLASGLAAGAHFSRKRNAVRPA
jgi:hypothetical protein